MSLTLWGFSDPWAEMYKIQKEMDKMFDSALTTSSGSQSTTRWSPAFDVKETDKEIVIHGDLPGLNKGDVKVELHDGVLTISGERKYEKKEEKEKYHRVERSYGKFIRSIPVGKDLKENDIKAKMENGVLEISYPKPQESKPKSIQIN